jgi:hypothetical protein
MRRTWVYFSALLLGIGLGTILVGARDARGFHFADAGRNQASASQSGHVPEAVGVRIGRLISGVSPAMQESVPINKALDLLFAERKSPLRTRAFLKSRIQMMTTEQLTQALTSGEVRSTAELAEIARRLAKEDPEGTFNRLEAGDLGFSRLENLYSFVDALLQTWGDTDAAAVLERLKKMKRGGSQQDYSLRFSGYWTKIDPAAAARNFDDLIYLRNMQDRGDMVFTDNSYAEEIVRSWQQKDGKAMEDYIGALPEGRKKEALEKAVKKSGDATGVK